MNRIFYAMVLIACLVAAAAHLLWSPAMVYSGHQTVQIGDRALVVGDRAASLLEGDTWRELSVPWLPRSGYAAVKLSDEAVLVVGGEDGSGQVLGSSYRFDLKTRGWRSVASLPTPVRRSTAVSLPDGEVMVLGGLDADGAPTQLAQRYLPDLDLWRGDISLPEPRESAAAAVLSTGEVLLVGGLGAGGSLPSPALFHEEEGRWQTWPSGPVGTGLTVTQMADGTVTVVGGVTAEGATASVWSFDLSSGFRQAEPLPASRAQHVTAALPDGGLLVAGGVDGDNAATKATYLYDPVGKNWRSTTAMQSFRVAPSLVSRGSGPLVIGGADGTSGVASAVQFLPEKEGWRILRPQTPMERLTDGMMSSAKSAVELAIGLIGVMTLFLGLMKVAEAGGLLTIIAKLIRPVMIRLFPEVPPDHPAMGAMILNMSANALGLGNAATPFGIRAMQELDRLNPHKGTATNSMALFLAINTSNVTLLPTGVIALRASVGSGDPAGILPTTLFATVCSTAAAITAAKLYQRFAPLPSTPSEAVEVAPEQASHAQEEALPEEASAAYPGWVSALALTALFLLIPATVWYGSVISPWIIPGIMLGLLSFGVARGVPVYEALVEGAKDGFQVAVVIIPYLVAILVAVGMFRSSGALDWVVQTVGPWTSVLGLPADALPMALLRPLSGSGAYGILASIIDDPAIGPDSYTGYLVSTFQGSTETTFYVLAVYFGAVQVRRTRHALPAALTADFVGVVAAIVICSWLYG